MTKDNDNSSAPHGPAGSDRPSRSVLPGVAIGLLGAVAIWLLTPYNDYVLGNARISNNQLPTSAVFFTLLLVLMVNPLLQWLRPRLMLSGGQVATAFAIMLVCCTLTQTNRMLPFSIAKSMLDVTRDERLASAYESMNLPRSLFAGPFGYNQPAPVAEHFIMELPAGESVPWSKWLAPLGAWGTFMASSWLMMLGLSIIVLHQWRRNERLAFPLLTLEQSLIEPPEPGRRVPPIFRRRSFWIGLLIVFSLHLLAGGAIYFPESVPAVPLRYNIQSLFTESPWAHLPAYIGANRIYFVFLGMTFFMPSRIGFSVWFVVIAYAGYIIVSSAYFPPFQWRVIQDQRTGAMLAVGLIILWLGRTHWARVLRAAVGWDSRSPEDTRNEAERARDRRAARMFLLGLAGMFAWLCWAGVQPAWAAALVGIAFLFTLLVTRLVAETGIPMIGMNSEAALDLTRLVPLNMLGPASIFFSSIIGVLFGPNGRVDCTTLSCHGLALDERATPQRQARMALGFVPMLAIGLVISGAAHLTATYHNTTTLDGAGYPINPWGTQQFNPSNGMLLEWQRGQWNRPTYNQFGHIGFGGALAGLLYAACLALPRWPIHPVGLLIVQTWWASQLWFSVFLGWVFKMAILKFGGSRLYSSARPFFLGVIMGDVAAMIFWALVPGLLAACGRDYKIVEVLPL